MINWDNFRLILIQVDDGLSGGVWSADYCRPVIRGWVMMGKWSGNFPSVTRSQYFNIFLPDSKVTKFGKNYAQADANGWPYQDLLAEISWKFQLKTLFCSVQTSDLAGIPICFLYSAQRPDDESCKFLTTLIQVGFFHEEIFNKLLYHKRTLKV